MEEEALNRREGSCWGLRRGLCRLVLIGAKCFPDAGSVGYGRVGDGRVLKLHHRSPILVVRLLVAF